MNDINDMLPIGNQVLVELSTSTVSKMGDIYIVNQKNPDTMEGIVVALGKYNSCEFEVKPGDLIVFPTEDSMTITKNNKKYKIVKNINILAIKEEA